ncbi:MAG: chorismate synthase [Bacteroidia bacterium]
MNTLGSLFKITSFGESHGPAIGVVIDGCPAQLEIDKDFIQTQLDKRRPGQSDITTSRKEEDKIEILSGVFEGKSTGAPITLLIKNKDSNPADYDHLKNVYRPSHADFTYQNKYGIRDHRGGGRSSARVTAGWVAAGAVAQLFLKKYSISITAYVKQVHTISLNIPYSELNFEHIEKNKVRCPHSETAALMEQEILKAKNEGDSLGGIISCVISNGPIGLGEPVFDKLNAKLAHAIMSINAVKGIQFGEGFNSVNFKGSELNDGFISKNGKTSTLTNHSGGIQGGISNGEDIYFETAFKPTATILKPQQTVDTDGNNTTLEATGRHDPCVLPRTVPIVEAMAALVLADLVLLQKAYSM